MTEKQKEYDEKYEYLLFFIHKNIRPFNINMPPNGFELLWDGDCNKMCNEVLSALKRDTNNWEDMTYYERFNRLFIILNKEYCGKKIVDYMTGYDYYYLLEQSVNKLIAINC